MWSNTIKLHLINLIFLPSLETRCFMQIRDLTRYMAAINHLNTAWSIYYLKFNFQTENNHRFPNIWNCLLCKNLFVPDSAGANNKLPCYLRLFKSNHRARKTHKKLQSKCEWVFHSCKFMFALIITNETRALKKSLYSN